MRATKSTLTATAQPRLICSTLLAARRPLTRASASGKLVACHDMVNACTIIARNYLAHARVLASSFFAHHPDGRFTLLVIDDEDREFDASRESFRCLRLSDIGLDRSEIGRLAAIYDCTELATAVKP
jgi:hypothetical protein